MAGMARRSLAFVLRLEICGCQDVQWRKLCKKQQVFDCFDLLQVIQRRRSPESECGYEAVHFIMFQAA